MSDCEGTSNPFVASCGALFDTYEEMAAHEREAHPVGSHGTQSVSEASGSATSAAQKSISNPMAEREPKA